MVNVLLALPLSQKFVDRLEAVAPGVHVIHATPLLRQLIRGDLPEDPVTVRQAEDEAADLLPQCEVLVGLARFPARALPWAPNLRWIAATSAGVDKLAPEVAERVVLTNGTGLGAEPIAEHVICSLMMLSRGSPVYLRQQVNHKWQRGFQAREISGLTMGVIGMGAIGRAVGAIEQTGGKLTIYKTAYKEPGWDGSLVAAVEQLRPVLPTAQFFPPGQLGASLHNVYRRWRTETGKGPRKKARNRAFKK